jgi:hypothetical protein
VENSTGNANLKSPPVQPAGHHHVTHNRRLQDLPPNEPRKTEPNRESRPLQEIERLIPELGALFRELWTNDPGNAGRVHKQILTAIKPPPKKNGRPRDDDTERGVQMHDQNPKKPLCEIVREVLGPERAKDAHARESLWRKINGVLKRRNKEQHAAPGINGHSPSLRE